MDIPEYYREALSIQTQDEADAWMDAEIAAIRKKYRCSEIGATAGILFRLGYLTNEGCSRKEAERVRDLFSRRWRIPPHGKSRILDGSNQSHSESP